MDSRQFRKDNLRIIISEVGKTKDVADQLGMPSSYISQITSKKALKGIGASLARRIETTFDKPHGWMDLPHGDEASLEPAAISRTPANKIPLISWHGALAHKETRDVLDLVHITIPARLNTFALLVDDVAEGPDFRAGTMLAVEPDMEACANDYVIVDAGGKRASIKRLIQDGGDTYLSPLNDRLPLKPIGTARIIGVVREVLRKLR